MKVNRLTVLVALLLVAASPKPDKMGARGDLPAKLQPYAELARLCEQYEKQVTVVNWREVWKQTYDTATFESWRPEAPPEPENEDPGARTRRLARTTTPVVTAEVVDGRECAVLDGSEMQNLYFRLGDGLVKGEFAIEFVGRAMSDRPCDLSIYCRQDGQNGPVFQFGARWNTQNFLRLPNPNGRSFQQKAAQEARKIEANRWHMVRLEIRNGKASASVDGKEVASLPAKPDMRTWTPNIYFFQSKIAVDEARIEMMAPSASEIDPAVAFAEVFGDRPREQVMAEIAQLVEALDDTDPRVREAAYAMLKPMGTITRDALQTAIDTGSAEQAGRAQQLMDELPQHAKRPTQ